MRAQVPVMSLEGNHEIEPDAHGRTFQAFHSRFRFPAEESESPSQLFYSFDLAGAPLSWGLACTHVSGILSAIKCVHLGVPLPAGLQL